MMGKTTEPRLIFFNLEKFVGELNSKLIRGVEPIELGPFICKPPRRNPFIHRIASREIDFVGKYQLTQEVRGGIMGLDGLDTEDRIGYILVESGAVDADESHDGAAYETIKVAIKQPIELEDRRVIPTSKVRIYI